MPDYKAVGHKIDNGPGRWDYTRVEIFDGDEKIGEYIKNYGSGARTFFPFEQDGKWYALYSRHYTATRVMSLPDCQDLGGEEPDGGGFCPYEYLVPSLCVQSKDDEPKPSSDNLAEILAWHDRHPFVHKYPKWGFISGCQWGSPGWVRFVDLSRVSEGVLKVDDRFGFYDTFGGIPLKDAMNFDCIDDADAPFEQQVISFARATYYDLSGKLRPEYGGEA